MAHNILYTPDNVVFSAAIPDIAVEVDGEYVDVDLVAYGAGEVLLAERYFAFDGMVTVIDLASLIEDYMLKNKLAYHQFTFRAFTDSDDNMLDWCHLNVIFCNRIPLGSTASNFASENFLSSLSIRRIPMLSDVGLSFFAQPGDGVGFTVNARYRRADTGEVDVFSYTENESALAEKPGVCNINFHTREIIAEIGNNLEIEDSLIELSAFTVSAGNRSMSFFIDNSLAGADRFFFRNCFNVVDCFIPSSVTTEKSTVERATAFINGRMCYYNQINSKEYQVETAALTSDEAYWIDQLFYSREIFLKVKSPDSNDWLKLDVIITDFTCEMADGDELNKAQFTWRLADNRPAIILSSRQRIFTYPYNTVFS